MKMLHENINENLLCLMSVLASFLTSKIVVSAVMEDIFKVIDRTVQSKVPAVLLHTICAGQVW